MIKLLNSLPKKLTVALSGGVDSMALLDFLSRKHDVNAAFFHHGTENSAKAWEFVSSFCEQRKINLKTGLIGSPDRKKGQSKEEHWREQRYTFLSSCETVVTGHNLDDCVETWVWSSLHGTPKLIPYSRGNVLRPLLCTRKAKLIEWCQKNNVPWVEDQSNTDTKYTRNFIRHELMGGILKVNPGIHKLIHKKIVEKYTISQK
jgi:tRNA(Ile)-lysidine synthase